MKQTIISSEQKLNIQSKVFEKLIFIYKKELMFKI